MWCGAVNYILILAFLTGSVLSHQTKNNGRVIANNSLEFRTSTNDEMTTLISTSSVVFHMEPDLYVPGNILFSEYSTLRTTDGITTTITAGSSYGNTVAVGQLAQFGYIDCFRQISPTHVVVVDSTNHCLRLVDRLTLQTPWYAGYCGSNGYSQGTTRARFYYPRGIIMDQKQAGMFLVADDFNDAIRHVEVTVGSGTSAVSQFYKSSTLDGPVGLTQDPISGDLYITTYRDEIYKLTYTTRSLTLLAGASPGFADGDFASSRFNNPSEIIIIDNVRKLILIDRYNRRLRLLDLITRRTSSLCTGQRGHSDGDMSTCTLDRPYSLMVLNNTLYVGEYRRIRKVQEVDECSSSPCASTGTCEVQVDGFICLCEAGYDGTLCNNNIDDCSPNPCVHGTCTDGVDSFSCSCDVGYQGTLCYIDTDDCSSSPCDSTGTCEDQVDGFICLCEPGYDGTLCNNNIDDCSPNPCAHGTCTDGVDSFSCSCEEGYEGRLCGVDSDDCASNPCDSTGTCEDQVDGFICLCEPGYDGTLCNNNIDDCSPNPCAHGTCTDGVDSFSCSCEEGYEGRLCGVDSDDCAPNPCASTTGTCVDRVDGFICLCEAGYDGTLCNNNIDDCSPNPCVHGTCTDRVDSFSCSCEEGYQGRLCGVDSDDCASNPCATTTETCVDQVDGFICLCEAGYDGTLCNNNIDDCSPNPCVHGTCTDGVDSFSCSCEEGYEGRLCGVDYDDCASNPCASTGTCEDQVDGFICLCEPGYDGTLCNNNIDDCSPNPCVHGTCTDGVNTFSCSCDAGYEGTLCYIETCISSFNSDNPCSNQQIRQSASPDTGLAVVNMEQLRSIVRLTLPPGNYPLSITTETANCTVDIGIADHHLKRRLVFQSQYDVRCEVPEGNIAEAPLTLIVARHAFDNSGICDIDCTRPNDVEIELDCTNHTLTVVWPSNITYTGDVNKIPSELEERLTTRIVAKGLLVYLFIPELNPPITFPQEEDNGGHMIARFSSYCVGENVHYVKVTDSCEEKIVDIPEM